MIRGKPDEATGQAQCSFLLSFHLSAGLHGGARAENSAEHVDRVVAVKRLESRVEPIIPDPLDHAFDISVPRRGSVICVKLVELTFKYAEKPILGILLDLV